MFNCPGLHVADGSVMPGPVGANPSLTIAALADRFADAMLEGAPGPGPGRRAGPARPRARRRRPRRRPGRARCASAFTEEMKGHLDFAETDYERAEAARARPPGAS